MAKSRTGVIVAGVAGVVLAAVVLIALLKPKGGEENQPEPDMAVHVGKVSRMTLHSFVTAYGQVLPQPSGVSQAPADSEVASPLAGVVARIFCVEGQRVAKGALLFELDSRMAQVAVEKARKALVIAQANFDRQAELLPVDGTSAKAYQESKGLLDAAKSDLASAETGLALLRIEAPLAGTVVKINSEPGEAVEANTVLAKIIDLDRLVIEAEVPSREAAALKPGQPAQARSGAPAGRVVYVGSAIDENSDTVTVRVSIPASAGYRPGQFLEVRVVSAEHKDVLAVPERALIAKTVGGTEGSLVLVEGEKAVHKPVTIGLREGGWVEVKAEGLKEGAVIVTDDSYAVPEEPTRVHVIK